MLSLTTALIFSSCSHIPLVSKKRPRKVKIGYEEVGYASWYGPKFHGRRTSSGEIFNMHDLTCAHRTLPLGTIVLVTNLENGKSVLVRVNDRGPFIRGRIVDLSYAAAKQIGMVRKGVVKVRIKVVGFGWKSLRWTGKGYWVQVAAFRSRKNALRMKKRLKPFGKARVLTFRLCDETIYRVRFGPFVRKKDAERLAKRLIMSGFSPIIMTR